MKKVDPAHEKAIADFLAKLGIKAERLEGRDMSDIKPDELMALIVAQQEGCFMSGDMSGAVIDVEPLDDSTFDENVFGVFHGKRQHEIYRVFAKDKVVPMPGMGAPAGFEGKKVAMLAIKEHYVRGIPLFFPVDHLQDKLKTLDVPDLISIYAMQERIVNGDPAKDPQLFPDMTEFEEMIKTVTAVQPKKFTVGSVFPVNKNGKTTPCVVIFEEKNGDLRYVEVTELAKQMLLGPDIPCVPYGDACQLQPMPEASLWEMLYNESMQELTGTMLIQKEALSGRFQTTASDGGL